MKFYLFLMILIAFFFNCSPSLVYSPTVYPASKPLDKGNIQAGASFSMLAEARPDEIGHKTSEGGEAFLRVALSNSSTVQIKWWRDISDHNFQNNSRSGLSFSSIHKLVYQENSYYLAIMPQFALLFDNTDVEGGGGYFFLILSSAGKKLLNPYLAVTPLLGIRDIYPDEYNNRKQWGWGAMGNLGVTAQLTKIIRLNIEVAGIYQINKFDRRTDSIFSPNIGLSAIF